jgi:hypothetical protein
MLDNFKIGFKWEENVHELTGKSERIVVRRETKGHLIRHRHRAQRLPSAALSKIPYLLSSYLYV